MELEIPPNYITRAAERLRELRKKKKPTEKRERFAHAIIAGEARRFLAECVRPTFGLDDVMAALGKALAKRRAGENATVMPMREMRLAPEPPPGHRLDRLPPEPPEEWMLEAARSRAPRMSIQPPVPPSRRAQNRSRKGQPGKGQQDFLPELLGCPQVSVP